MRQEFKTHTSHTTYTSTSSANFPSHFFTHSELVNGIRTLMVQKLHTRSLRQSLITHLYHFIFICDGASSGAVGWGTAPQDWRSCFRSPIGCLEISSDLMLLSAFSSPRIHTASNRNKYQGISLGVKSGRSVVLNVKVRMEPQRCIPPLNLYGLWEIFTFYIQ
jgi:hypothetical protein